MPDSRVDTILGRLENLITELAQRGEDRLPPETELSRDLGASRATVREALGRLEAKGLVDRRRGRGTTIVPRRQPVRYPANIIGSFSDFLRSSGVTHELVDFSVTRVELNDTLPRLGDGNGPAWGFRSVRCYAIDGVRSALLYHLLPHELRGEPVRVEELRADIVPFLENVQGVNVARVTSAITAEEAPAEVAERLAMNPGAALLVMYTRMIDDEGSPIALGALAFNPRVISLGVEALEHVTASGQPELAVGWLGSEVVSA